VIGRTHELHVEVPVAFVRLRPGAPATPAELRAFTHAHVEDCGVPEGNYPGGGAAARSDRQGGPTTPAGDAGHR